MADLYRVKIDNTELKEKLRVIDELAHKLEREAAFLSCKSPILTLVPADADDCIRVGELVLSGANTLTEAQRASVKALLESCVSTND